MKFAISFANPQYEHLGNIEIYQKRISILESLVEIITTISASLGMYPPQLFR